MRSCLIVLIIILCKNGILYSDDYLSPDQLLGELKNNNTLKAMRHKINSLKYFRESENRFVDPVLKFEVQRLPATRPYQIDNVDMYMFVVEQEIILPQKVKARVDIEELELKKTEQLYNQIEIELGLKIYTLFYKYFYAYKCDEIFKKELALLNKIREIALKRSLVSGIATAEILKIESEIMMVENKIEGNNSELSAIKNEIKYLLGRSTEEDLLPPSDFEIIKVDSVIDEKEIESLIKRRPELAVKSLEVKKMEAMKKYKDYLTYIPDFAIGGGYQLSPHMTDGLFFMISLNIPWFNKKNDYEKLVTEEMIREEALMYEDKLNMNKTDVYSQIRRLRSYQNMISNQLKVIKNIEQSLDIELSMYEKGLAPYINIIVLIQDLYKTQLEFFKMKSEYAILLSDLFRCCGLPIKSSFIKKEEDNDKRN